MNFSDLQSKIEELNFSDIVKNESKDYLRKIELNYNLPGKDYRKLFLNGLKNFHKNDDKIIYLTEALNYFNNEIEDYKTLINNHSNEFEDYDYRISSIWKLQTKQDYDKWKEKKLLFEAQIFYVVRDLEKLGLTNLDANAFTLSEVTDLERKINAILIKLDELSVGHEIIFDSINDLKTDFKELKDEFPLGKKRWYQRAAGVVISYAGTKGADNVLEVLKPTLKDFFVKHVPHLIENL